MSPDISTVVTYVQSDTDYGTVTAATGRELIIRGFNGYLREVKLFSLALGAGNIMRLYRQQINSELYWGSNLLLYYKLDESMGLRLLDFTTGSYLEMDEDSGSNLLPEWSIPSSASKLTICEGDSIYSLSGG